MPNAEVRVIAAIHAGSAGSFNILTPGDGTVPFVFLDAADGCRYVEQPQVVSMFEQIFTSAGDRCVSLGVCGMTTAWRESTSSSNQADSNCGEIGHRWRKSTRSSSQGNGDCVEARVAQGGFEVRDSKLGEGSPIFGLATLLHTARR